jgi:diguanylate cyclase (GGDEF)-like protein/PAS domain S-box-containing protein
MKLPRWIYLDGYLPPELEKEYRLHYLKRDTLVAISSMFLLGCLSLTFIYNDFLLFGLSRPFYFLIEIRCSFAVISLALIFVLWKNRNFSRFDWLIFTWLILGIAVVTVINLTRPVYFSANLVLDVIMVFLIYLGLPIRMRMRLAGGFILMACDFAVFLGARQLTAATAAYTSLISMLTANIIASFASGQLYTLRRSEFSEGVSEQKIKEDLLRNSNLLNETGRTAKVGGWEFDVNTSQVTWTDEVYRIHELDPEYKLTVEDGIKYYAPEAIPVITLAVQRAKDLGEPFDLELPLITARGNHIWVHAIGRAIYNDGKIEKVGGTFQDITDRKTAENEIKKAADAWQATFDSITDLVSIQDSEFKLVRVNKAYAEVLKMKPEELVGKHCYEVVHGLSCPIANCPHEQVMKTSASASTEVFEPRLGIWVEVSCSPIYSEEGRLEGSVHIIKDINERKKAEDERKKAADEIHDLYNKAPAGYHSLNKDGVFTQINDTELQWLGYTREEVIGKKFSDFLTPREREDFLKNFSGFQNRGFSVNTESEIVRKDGSVMHVLLNATIIRDEAGNYLMSRTTVNDFTEIKRLQSVLAESELKYRTILEEMNDAYYELDLNGNFTFANSQTGRMLGLNSQELIGKHFEPFVAPEYAETLTQEYRRLRDTGASSRGSIFKAVRKDGVTLFVESSVTLKRDAKGTVTGYCCVGRDVSERVAFEQRIAGLATHDPLTGLPNRLLLYDRFHVAQGQAQRAKKKLALMELDLDHFKTVNDTMGHAAGDQLLKLTAERLNSAVRQSDTVARLGGDEFVVLLSEVNRMEDVEKTARKIITAFGKPFVIDGAKLNISTSIGIALFPDNGDAIDDLLKKADTAMYYVKEHGRNSYKLS